MFEELSGFVLKKFPSLVIEGDIYPPPAWRGTLAKIIQIVKFGLILCVILGIDPFNAVGYPIPRLTEYASQNKISFCLIVFMCGNLAETQLLSTGAFEIFLNDMPIWSKLDSQRIPQPYELLQIISNQIHFKAPGDSPSFKPDAQWNQPPSSNPNV